jgi:hypothetical protein
MSEGKKPFLIIITILRNCEFQLRNKSWKPECVGSFNMDLVDISILSRARSEG